MRVHALAWWAARGVGVASHGTTSPSSYQQAAGRQGMGVASHRTAPFPPPRHAGSACVVERRTEAMLRPDAMVSETKHLACISADEGCAAILVYIVDDTKGAGPVVLLLSGYQWRTSRIPVALPPEPLCLQVKGFLWSSAISRWC